MIASTQRHPRQAGPPRGFTLIEILLALAVFSIGLLAIAGMQTSSVTGNSYSRMNTMAVEYAADYMERLLSLGVGLDLDKNGVDDDGDGTVDDDDEVLNYHDLRVGTHRPDDDTPDYDGDGVEDIDVHPLFDDIFDMEWTVAAAAFNPPGVATPSPVRRITMTVSWANGARFVRLTGLRAQAL